MRSHGSSVTVAIISAIAEAEGVEETELDMPLSDVIDPDALDGLFRDTTGVLTFTFAGYRVEVTDRELVRVTPYAAN